MSQVKKLQYGGNINDDEAPIKIGDYYMLPSKFKKESFNDIDDIVDSYLSIGYIKKDQVESFKDIYNKIARSLADGNMELDEGVFKNKEYSNEPIWQEPTKLFGITIKGLTPEQTKSNLYGLAADVIKNKIKSYRYTPYESKPEYKMNFTKAFSDMYHPGIKWENYYKTWLDVDPEINGKRGTKNRLNKLAAVLETEANNLDNDASYRSKFSYKDELNDLTKWKSRALSYSKKLRAAAKSLRDGDYSNDDKLNLASLGITLDPYLDDYKTAAPLPGTTISENATPAGDYVQVGVSPEGVPLYAKRGDTTGGTSVADTTADSVPPAVDSTPQSTIDPTKESATINDVELSETTFTDNGFLPIYGWENKTPVFRWNGVNYEYGSPKYNAIIQAYPEAAKMVKDEVKAQNIFKLSESGTTEYLYNAGYRYGSDITNSFSNIKGIKQIIIGSSDALNYRHNKVIVTTNNGNRLSGNIIHKDNNYYFMSTDKKTVFSLGNLTGINPKAISNTIVKNQMWGNFGDYSSLRNFIIKASEDISNNGNDGNRYINIANALNDILYRGKSGQTKLLHDKDNVPLLQWADAKNSPNKKSFLQLRAIVNGKWKAFRIFFNNRPYFTNSKIKGSDISAVDVDDVTHLRSIREQKNGGVLYAQAGVRLQGSPQTINTPQNIIPDYSYDDIKALSGESTARLANGLLDFTSAALGVVPGLGVVSTVGGLGSMAWGTLMDVSDKLDGSSGASWAEIMKNASINTGLALTSLIPASAAARLGSAAKAIIKIAPHAAGIAFAVDAAMDPAKKASITKSVGKIVKGDWQSMTGEDFHNIAFIGRTIMGLSSLKNQISKPKGPAESYTVKGTVKGKTVSTKISGSKKPTSEEIKQALVEEYNKNLKENDTAAAVSDASTPTVFNVPLNVETHYGESLYGTPKHLFEIRSGILKNKGIDVKFDDANILKSATLPQTGQKAPTELDTLKAEKTKLTEQVNKLNKDLEEANKLTADDNPAVIKLKETLEQQKLETETKLNEAKQAAIEATNKTKKVNELLTSTEEQMYARENAVEKAKVKNSQQAEKLAAKEKANTERAKELDKIEADLNAAKEGLVPAIQQEVRAELDAELRALNERSKQLDQRDKELGQRQHAIEAQNISELSQLLKNYSDGIITPEDFLTGVNSYRSVPVTNPLEAARTLATHLNLDGIEVNGRFYVRGSSSYKRFKSFEDEDLEQSYAEAARVKTEQARQEAQAMEDANNKWLESLRNEHKEQVEAKGERLAQTAETVRQAEELNQLGVRAQKYNRLKSEKKKKDYKKYNTERSSKNNDLKSSQTEAQRILKDREKSSKRTVLPKKQQMKNPSITSSGKPGRKYLRVETRSGKKMIGEQHNKMLKNTIHKGLYKNGGVLVEKMYGGSTFNWYINDGKTIPLNFNRNRANNIYDGLVFKALNNTANKSNLSGTNDKHDYSYDDIVRDADLYVASGRYFTDINSLATDWLNNNKGKSTDDFISYYNSQLDNLQNLRSQINPDLRGVSSEYIKNYNTSFNALYPHFFEGEQLDKNQISTEGGATIRRLLTTFRNNNDYSNKRLLNIGGKNVWINLGGRLQTNTPNGVDFSKTQADAKSPNTTIISDSDKNPEQITPFKGKSSRGDKFDWIPLAKTAAFLQSQYATNKLYDTLKQQRVDYQDPLWKNAIYRDDYLGINKAQRDGMAAMHNEPLTSDANSYVARQQSLNNSINNNMYDKYSNSKKVYDSSAEKVNATIDANNEYAHKAFTANQAALTELHNTKVGLEAQRQSAIQNNIQVFAKELIDDAIGLRKTHLQNWQNNRKLYFKDKYNTDVNNLYSSIANQAKADSAWWTNEIAPAGVDAASWANRRNATANQIASWYASTHSDVYKDFTDNKNKLMRDYYKNLYWAGADFVNGSSIYPFGRINIPEADTNYNYVDPVPYFLNYKKGGSMPDYNKDFNKAMLEDSKANFQAMMDIVTGQTKLIKRKRKK